MVAVPCLCASILGKVDLCLKVAAYSNKLFVVGILFLCLR